MKSLYSGKCQWRLTAVIKAPISALMLTVWFYSFWNVYFQQATTVIMVLFPLHGRAKKLPVEIVTVPASVSATGQKMPGTFPRRHLWKYFSRLRSPRLQKFWMPYQFSYIDLENTALWQVWRWNRNGLSSPLEIVITTGLIRKIR